MNETALPNDVESLKAMLIEAQSKIASQASLIQDLEVTIKEFMARK
ncbi:hypothetical protein [Pseudobacteriovorax antillogorgiicola]|nr:hypothetical protein [Pseudobacteriovorax antillogorgiicola]